MKKKKSGAIHVLVTLEKFGDDPTNTFGVKCVTDRQTDRRTHSDNNSSAGLRKVELKIRLQILYKTIIFGRQINIIVDIEISLVTIQRQFDKKDIY